MTDPKPLRKQKQKEKEPKSQPAALSGNGNGTERLKTVVRRLPPNLPEEIFWESVRAWVSDETVSWKAYYPGKLRMKRMNKEGVPSRAYIAFKSEQQVALFSRGYDGHVFRDKAGNESHAVVEFAPFQKTPTEKRKTDARNNTIDKDDDYRSFLEALRDAKPESASVSLEALLAASHPAPPPTTTPLLEALKAEKSAQKDKEAILRNHAHYKDVKDGTRKEKEDAIAKKKPVAAPAKAAVPLPPKKGRKEKERERAPLKAPTQGPAPGLDAPGKTLGIASSAKPAPLPTQAPAVRHRPPKIHPPRGDLPGPLSAPVLASFKPGPASPAPSASTITATATPTGTDAQRKPRPVLGLGRHFESALNGAVSSKKPAVPSMSILQRPTEGGEVVPAPVITQRAGEIGEGGPGAGASPGSGASAGRGARRGRGRGRGNRGG